VSSRIWLGQAMDNSSPTLECGEDEVVFNQVGVWLRGVEDYEGRHVQRFIPWDKITRIDTDGPIDDPGFAVAWT
jgi:hypothetical protein